MCRGQGDVKAAATASASSIAARAESESALESDERASSERIGTASRGASTAIRGDWTDVFGGGAEAQASWTSVRERIQTGRNASATSGDASTLKALAKETTCAQDSSRGWRF